MRVYRLLERPVAFSVALALLTAADVAAQGSQSVQKLLERGALEEAVQRAEGERENPEALFFAAQAATKMKNTERAVEEYTRLQQTSDDAWRAIGESGARLAEGNSGEAMAAAERAIAASGDNPFAHFQAGMAANRQSNYQRAQAAFSRAVELKPDLAYAHYYAGTASQHLRQTAKMSEHFEMFLKLAPEAPERTAVSALLRTLRPR
jgi:tetratricopeptide (TPR) repeat protein